MTFTTILQLAREQIALRVQKQDIVIDATVGNGHDTVFLAQLLDENGIVYGFDIQQKAIEQTKLRLTQYLTHHKSNQRELSVPTYRLFHTSHANMKAYVEDIHHGHIAGIMFNLGYMPKENHLITTHADSTIAGLQASLDLLRIGGMISIVVYTGHSAGLSESRAIEEWSAQLPQTHFQVVRTAFINQINHPPYWIGITKTKLWNHMYFGATTNNI